MKKLLLIAILLVGLSGGGYFYLQNYSHQAAIKAVEQVKASLIINFEDSNFTYDEVRANIITQTAIIKDPNIFYNGEQLLTAKRLEIAGDDKLLRKLALFDVAFSFAKDDSIVRFTADEISIEEVPLEQIDGFLLAIQMKPELAAVELIKILPEEIWIENLHLTAAENQLKEVIKVSGDFLVEDMVDGVAGLIRVSTLIEDKSGLADSTSVFLQMDDVEVLGLDVNSILSTIQAEPEADLSEALNLFGITNLDIENFYLSIPSEELTMSAKNHRLVIDDQIIEQFKIEEFAFNTDKKNTEVTFQELSFDGIDLKNIDVFDDSIAVDAGTLFSLGELEITDINVSSEVFAISIAAVGCSAIKNENENTFSREHYITDVSFPIKSLEFLDRQAKEKIHQAVQSDQISLNFISQFIYEKESLVLQNHSEFQLNDLAEFDAQIELGGLDIEKVMKKKIHQASDLPLEDLEFKKIEIEYTDQELANILFDIYPQLESVFGLMNVWGESLLSLYPEEKKAFTDASRNFLEGKNQVRASAVAEFPIKLSDIPELFISGELNQNMRIDFFGS